MKTIGFIGAYDKTDLIIYIARILTAMNKRVLVIDTTFLQKAKYIVPAISPAKTDRRFRPCAGRCISNRQR